MAKLASDLGFALIVPHGRGIRLSHDGKKLAGAGSRALHEIGEALREIRSSSSRTPIILSCERSLATRWLIPRLSAFQDIYPDIEVHLSTGGGALDFSRENITIAIRRLDFPVAPDWTIVKLMPERVGPVMLSAMRPRFEAGDYVALGSRTRPQAWQAWLDQRRDAPRPRNIQLLDHHFLMVEAALGGLGVALAPQAIASDDARLESPCGFDADGTDYALIYPRSAPMSQDISSLINWITALEPG